MTHAEAADKLHALLEGLRDADCCVSDSYFKSLSRYSAQNLQWIFRIARAYEINAIIAVLKNCTCNKGVEE